MGGQTSQQRSRCSYRKFSNEAVYNGELEGQTRNGFGTWIYSNSDRYEGSWFKNEKHGYGLMYYHTGELYMGHWVHDEKEGYGIHFYMKGDRYEGEWQNNMRHGYGKIYSLRGYCFEGGFYKNLKNEVGYVNDGSGNVYKEDWNYGWLKKREQISGDDMSVEMEQQDVLKLTTKQVWDQLGRLGFPEFLDDFQALNIGGSMLLNFCQNSNDRNDARIHLQSLIIFAINQLNKSNRRSTSDLPYNPNNIYPGQASRKITDSHFACFDSNCCLPYKQHSSENEENKLYDYINSLTLINFGELSIREKIGEGGYASIYKGNWLGIPVAIKIFKNKADKASLQEFKTETEVISNLRHPNTILFMGASLYRDRYCIITEYAENGSLFDYLHVKKKRLSAQKQLKVALGMAWGLAYLHQMQVLHCDIKSSNIMLTDELNVKIADFGLSRKNWKHIQLSGRVGTTHWMAPEVLRSETYTEKSDVYSFGALVWEMLKHEVPYRDLSCVQIIGSVGWAQKKLEDVPGKLGLLAKAWLNHDEQSRPGFQKIVTKLMQWSGTFLPCQCGIIGDVQSNFYTQLIKYKHSLLKMSSKAKSLQKGIMRTHKSVPRILKKLSPRQQFENLNEIEQSLAEVAIALRHKQRLVAKINNNTANVDEEYKTEINTRDAYIDELNKRIIELEAVLTEKGKTTTRELDFDKISADMKNMMTDNANLQNRCSHLENMLTVEKGRANKVEDQQQTKYDELRIELEEALTQIKVKEEEVEESKEDLVRINQVVLDMTKLNNDLNEKITSLNETMESTIREGHQKESQSPQVEALESNLEESSEHNKNLQVQLKKANASVEYLKSEKEAAEAWFKHQESLLSEISETLLNFSSKCEENSESLASVISGLEESSAALKDIRTAFEKTILRDLPEEFNDNTKSITDELLTTKQSLLESEANIRLVTSDAMKHSKKIEELETMLAQSKLQVKEQRTHDKTIIDRLRLENGRLKTRSDELAQAHSIKDVRLNKVENINSLAQNRLEKLNEQLDDKQSRSEHLEILNKETRGQVAKLQMEKTQRQNEFAAKDQRVRKAASLIRAYEEEIFKRDSEILRKESKIQQMQTQLDELRRVNKKVNNRMNSAVSTQLESANKIIKDKNSEIALLKGMVRSSQSTMKSIQNDQDRKTSKKGSVALGSPNRSVDIQSSLSLVLDYIFELKEIEDWVKSKQNAFSTDVMDADEIGRILGVDVKGTGDLNVGQALADVKGDKVGKAYKYLETNLRQAEDTISVKQLKERANYEKLDALLGDTSEETLSCEQVLAILERL